MKSYYENYMAYSQQAHEIEEQLKNRILSKLKSTVETEDGRDDWEVIINYIPTYRTIKIYIGLRPLLNYEENEISTEAIKRIDEIIGTSGTILTYTNRILYDIEFQK